MPSAPPPEMGRPVGKAAPPWAAHLPFVSYSAPPPFATMVGDFCHSPKRGP